MVFIDPLYETRSEQNKAKVQNDANTYIQQRKNNFSIYTKAGELSANINAAIKATSKTEDRVDPATMRAAKNLVKELNDARKTWEDNITSNLSAPSNNKLDWNEDYQNECDNKFVQKCQSIVNKYKNKTTYDSSSFLDQIKGLINDFSRACVGVKVFSVKLSPISSAAAKNNQPGADIEKSMEDIQDYRAPRQ
ncbi:MAG: hypothetical protein CK424_01490 [Legionella sp.]|nr:MAG: hypothetical protein CK424_01490 [Legionella sp.]